MNKFAVYTVITGGFDGVQQPLVIDKRFDYILFVDEPQSATVGVWQVRPIGYSHPDARQRSRFPKVHPEICLADYEASLYIDGNIQVTSQWVYDRCVELYESGAEWSGVRHVSRNSIYEELDEITMRCWVHDYDALKWYIFLRNDGYGPAENTSFGFFYENGIIFRRHTEKVKQVEDVWWWTLENWVRRDQFSLMYALWKVGDVKTDFILPKNETIYKNSGHFSYGFHNPNVRQLPLSAWERFRISSMKLQKCETPYIVLFEKIYTQKNPFLMLNLYTVYVILRYGLIITLDKIYRMIKIKVFNRK